MRYKRGFKYQLNEEFTLTTPIRPAKPIYTSFIDLNEEGWLVIRAGYAWDGASGPTIDTDNSMVASLVHDSLYQLIRMEMLDRTWRTTADTVLYELCVSAGMYQWRAKLWYRSVSSFAKGAADPKNAKKVFQVPNVKLGST